MPTDFNDATADSPLSDMPIVEVILEIGDSVRIGNRILRIMDIDGESSMLRVDPVTEHEELPEDWRWSELPR